MELTVNTIFQSQEVLVGGKKETPEMKGSFRVPTKQRRSKSVSIYRSGAPRPADSMAWSLQLKKSSASTNVSILNLADKQSSSSESESEESPKSETENVALCKNMEQEQQEVEDLDNICNQLEDKLSCITKKLRVIDGKRDDLNNMKYEVLKDMSSLQGLLQTAESKNKTALLRDMDQNMISLCRSLKDQQCSLETAEPKAEPSREVEKQDMTKLMAAIEEIRRSTAQMCVNFETMSSLLMSMQKTVIHINTRIESFLSQGSCAKEQQEGLTDDIQEQRAIVQPSPNP
ncbi:testis-specific serine kinase substrate isoform X2 [Ranitomeya variabilis]|uniref:testis-specific serine kinase substrate isoform X2 n=1 Tax=Ranitomeya variabilis TaxID=490064 RepID=UPI0040568B69